MTVPSSVAKSGPYLCNGVTDVFNYDFRIVDKTHLNVILADAAGVETTLDLTTHYTVSDVGSDVGTINLTSAGVALAVTGTKLTILRNPPFTQETDLQNQGAYLAQTVEDRLDLLTMQVQTVKERSDRSIAVPASDESTTLDDLQADLITVAAIAPAVSTVAANDADVSTVAGISADVTTVAGVAADIPTVADVASDIPAVAGIASSIPTVADNVTDITNFSDVYLGPKATAPTLRNDGSALQKGDLYFDTVSDKQLSYTGSSWVGGTGDMLAANNLSDLADASVAFNTLAPDGAGRVTMPKFADNVRASLLVNAMRAAESFGSGASADGKTFVDLLNSTDTLDMASSSNVQFRQGGVEPTSGPGTAADAAYALTSGSNPGWTGATIAVQLTADAIADAAENCRYVRATWRAGTGGGLTIDGAFIGVHLASSAGEFDPAYPVVPLMFAGATSGAATAGNTLVSDWAEYQIPVGKALYVAYYVSAEGYVATKTQTGWQTFQKTSANEPAKYVKSGYGNTATVLGLERLEYANTASTSLTLTSKQLPLSAAPTKVDVTLFLDCSGGDVGDFSLSLSRDGATWKAVTLGALYTVNGKIGRAAYGVDLSSGAGTGSALYWKAATANGKAIKVTALAVRQEDGIFTDVPSVPLKPGAQVVTRHMQATGLGYDDPNVKYGRLWGFTQDWVTTGPTRFKIKFHAHLVMTSTPMANPTSNPVGTTPVMFSLAATVTKAATLAALGAKSVVETDTTPYTGNNALKWLGFSSGNIFGTQEHYKEAIIEIVYDAPDPAAYRFEGWGISATDADPNVSGHITLNWEEAFGRSAGGGYAYNGMAITAEPLR